MVMFLFFIYNNLITYVEILDTCLFFGRCAEWHTWCTKRRRKLSTLRRSQAIGWKWHVANNADCVPCGHQHPNGSYREIWFPIRWRRWLFSDTTVRLAAICTVLNTFDEKLFIKLSKLCKYSSHLPLYNYEFYEYSFSRKIDTCI